MEKRANETKQNKNKRNPKPVPFVRDFPQAGGKGPWAQKALEEGRGHGGPPWGPRVTRTWAGPGREWNRGCTRKRQALGNNPPNPDETRAKKSHKNPPNPSSPT